MTSSTKPISTCTTNCTVTSFIFFHFHSTLLCLQCYDTVGSVAGRASSL